MTFEKLSPKQKIVFKWCHQTDYKAIICDGAVRSGKTVCMAASYILWAMRNFNGANFGICGKTIASAERNIIRPLESIVDITAYFKCQYKSGSQNIFIVENDNVKNYFYVFGGKDVSSYQLLQGITLSGVLFDEVALMPENFVQQGLARCLSVENAKYWFNCNPESPHHWFYQEWLLQTKKRNALHLHFLMDDNPTITKKQLEEAKTQFSGVFFERYILGLWVMAEGLIYPMYEDAFGEPPENEKPDLYALSIDYGTMNAFAATLWGRYGNEYWAIDEYYYSGRDKGVTKTDDEYYNDLEKFLDERGIKDRIYTVIDPSAASFISLLRKSPKYNVWKAKNDVVKGIELTAVAMQRGIIKFSNTKCKSIKKEFGGYVWDEKSTEDRPVKINDHCLTADTMVMTESGEKPISELIGTKGRVWSYNTETGTKELKPYSDCRLTQKQAKIFKIKLSDGRFIRCTEDHPILTNRGYIKAKDLNSTDRIIDIS